VIVGEFVDQNEPVEPEANERARGDLYRRVRIFSPETERPAAEAIARTGINLPT
jgi:hypothetical protein